LIIHRLGSVLSPPSPSLPSPVVVGPGSGVLPSTPPNIWERTFPTDPSAKFVMLHFDGTAMGPSDSVEIMLGYDKDIYKTSWGPDFWSRPVKGDTVVTYRYISGPGSTGKATLDKYGRGEATKAGGLDNTNADLFLISSPYMEPTYFDPKSLVSGHTRPSWVPVACIPGDKVIQDTARSVGLYVDVDRDDGEYTLPEDGPNHIRLSSCTATLIAPDLIITAGHCTNIDDQAKTGSFTLDYQTECDGSRRAGYIPKFYKMKRVVKHGGYGWSRPAGDTRPPLDYTIIQIETPPGGIGAPPVPIRPSTIPLRSMGTNCILPFLQLYGNP